MQVTVTGSFAAGMRANSDNSMPATAPGFERLRTLGTLKRGRSDRTPFRRRRSWPAMFAGPGRLRRGRRLRGF